MKRFFALAFVALAACSPPEGQGFAKYNVGNYLSGGSGQGYAFNLLAFEEDESVPGMGSLPAGYIPGLERIENGNLVTYEPNALTLQASDNVRSVRPLSGKVAAGSQQGSSAKASKRSVEKAFGLFARTQKQRIRLGGKPYSLATVSVDGYSFAVVESRAFLGAASREQISSEIGSYTSCPPAGGIWMQVGSGTQYAVQLTCTL